MKANIYADNLVGLIPENDNEKKLLESLFKNGIFAQSFGVHGVEEELRLIIRAEDKVGSNW